MRGRNRRRPVRRSGPSPPPPAPPGTPPRRPASTPAGGPGERQGAGGHGGPGGVQAARRSNAGGGRIVEREQQESGRIVAKAKEQAAFLIDERGLTEAAEAEGRRIVQDALGEAADVRRGSDEYAADVLVHLEGEVVKALQSIRGGIELLAERRAPGGAAVDSQRYDEQPDVVAADRGSVR